VVPVFGNKQSQVIAKLENARSLGSEHLAQNMGGTVISDCTRYSENQSNEPRSVLS
jgi:hypothetical protein